MRNPRLFSLVQVRAARWAFGDLGAGTRGGGFCGRNLQISQPGESDQLLICALVADLGSSWRIRVNAVAMMEVLSGVFVGSVRSASCDDYDLSL